MLQMEQTDRQGPVFWRTTLIDADEAVSIDSFIRLIPFIDSFIHCRGDDDEDDDECVRTTASADGDQ